ncbi:uncharacterized protein LOC143300628 [Babylonia areolata]|uniref:uncharacterized protein LOC143300628 n=1 Tax=Babylonia areolata TaxID=304850 RepID=UPI003FCFDA7F
MAEKSETTKSGYLDVKQSSKVKGRKLKTWRRRWVVVRKMTDLAAGTLSARVDLHPCDPASRQGQGQGQGQAERVTFVLDPLSEVREANSRTHPFAFELLEVEPVLVLSGTCREESRDWVTALSHMFFAGDVSARFMASYTVTIQPNNDSRRFELSGLYTLCISPEGVSLKARASTQRELAKKFLTMENPCYDSKAHKRSSSYDCDKRADSQNGGLHAESTRKGREEEEEEGEEEEEEEGVVLSWRLSMLKRFDVEDKPGQPLLFLFDCGPHSPTGEATFQFITDEAHRILESFRKCIKIVMEKRKHLDRYASTPDLRPPRNRTISTVTGYQALLARSANGQRVQRTSEAEFEASEHGLLINRSMSMSSSSSTTPVSPTSSAGEFLMSEDSVKGESREKSVAVRSPRQRISVVSMPSGFLSSSPRTSDTFGSYQLPAFPSSSPRGQDHLGSFMQQQMVLQQQQPDQAWPMQQVSAWPPQQVNSPFFPAPLSSPVPPSPVQRNHRQPFQLENPQQQQLQLWIQQQQQQQGNQLASPGTPPPCRLRIRRNSSVPDTLSFPTEIGDFDKIDSDVLLRRRTSSLNADKPFASGSICSADSGVVTDPTNPRKGSNSFGSTMSTESSRSGRKASEGVSPILESPLGVAVGPSGQPKFVFSGESGLTPDTAAHIYQDLDSIKAEGSQATRRRSSSNQEMGRRRHSTGNVSHSDYEELDAVKKSPGGDGPGGARVDSPPELPARPSFFGQGKTPSPGRKGLAGVLQGLRSLSFRDSKQRDSSSEETLTSTRYIEGLLSRSGSVDIYDTISDTDSRTFRRSSSDVTPVASHPDLHIPDRLAAPWPKAAATDLSGSVDLADGPGDSAKAAGRAGNRSTCQSPSLLSFPDGEGLPAGAMVASRRRGACSSKSALLDFFLDDVSFHSNPMVTGDLRASQALKSAGTDSSVTSLSPSPKDSPVFPEPSPPAAEGWAVFPDFPAENLNSAASLSPSDPFGSSSSWAQEEVSRVETRSSSDPFGSSSSWAQEVSRVETRSPSDPFGDSSPWPQGPAAGGGVGGAGSVYMDMRKQHTGDTDATCEYVASDNVSKDQVFLDSFVFP